MSSNEILVDFVILDREGWSVVELVAAQKSELRETKDELASVSRELSSNVKRSGEIDVERQVPTFI